jgi:hypothetical protein
MAVYSDDADNDSRKNEQIGKPLKEWDCEILL